MASGKKRSTPPAPQEHGVVEYEARHKRHAERQLRKDLFISTLAIVSVAIGLYDLARPRTSPDLTWLDVVDLAIVAIFIIDFVVSAHASGDWARYARKHWYEIPSLIPLTGNMTAGADAIPLLRGLRLVRLVRVFRLLRVLGAAARLDRFWRKAARVARRAHVAGLALFAAAMVLVGAAVAWLFEAPHNARFAEAGDALWWAVNMISNVAYVDFQPATTAGRVVAALLEFTGIAFIGLFTASLAGALLTDKEEPAEARQPPLD